MPKSLKSAFRNSADFLAGSAVNSRSVLRALHQSDSGNRNTAFHFFDRRESAAQHLEGNLPIPPSDLRMGYGTGSEEDFLKSGARTAEQLRALMSDHTIVIEPGDAALEWGCATGRVLRCFAEEAEYADIWGIDLHVPSITWAKDNLSPPFRFTSCTSYPHLPFEDGHFKFIYAISVFTHIEHLLDMWLMELRRIVEVNGFVIVTLHDENTVKYFQENGRPVWIPKNLSLEEILEHEVCVIRGEHWGQTYTIFQTDWIRREFGRYFDVLEIRPFAEGYQSAIVLRKS